MLSLDTRLPVPEGSSLLFATELDGPVFVFRDESDHSGSLYTPSRGFQHLGKLALKAATRCVERPSIAFTFALPDGRQDQTLVMEWSPQQGLNARYRENGPVIPTKLQDRPVMRRSVASRVS